MKYKDYYGILGIPQNAGDKDIKQAFRMLARKYHPDANKGNRESEERFKEINEAYEVLSDPEKRSRYDQMGEAWADWQQQGGRAEDFDWDYWTSAPSSSGQHVYVRQGTPEDIKDLFGGGEGVSFSDFFQQLFGGGTGGSSRGQNQAPDNDYGDFENYTSGSSGRGGAGSPFGDFFGGGSSGKPRPNRSGVRIRSSQGGGNSGTGGVRPKPQSHVYEHPQPQPQAQSQPHAQTQSPGYEQPVDITLEEAFKGTSRLLQMGERRLEVQIPAGADNGTRVRIPGEVIPGMGKAADIYLIIEVQPHTRYERKGDDLYIHVNVDLYAALLGGEVAVPLLNGKTVMLRIPPETQNGHAIRLRGKGMPRLQQPDNPGDLYVVVDIRLPTGLSAQERALFEQLRQLREGR